MLAASRKKVPTCLLLSAWLLCLAPVRCAAWGNTAHRIIARVALSQLSAQAVTRVKDILQKDDFVASATYADEVRPLRPDTARWHFVDIPKGASYYIARRDCVDGDCLVAVVERFQRYLTDSTREGRPVSADDVEALKFLIHLVGDLGQPFHCYDDGDRGGNTIEVRFFDRKTTNLHAVWDSYMLERMLFPFAPRAGKAATLTGLLSQMKSISSPAEDEYAKQLIGLLKDPRRFAARFPGQSMDGWRKGGPEDWATDSHAIALAALNLDASAELQKMVKPMPAKLPVTKKSAAVPDALWPVEEAPYFVRPVAWRERKRGTPVPEISERYYSANSLIVEQQLLKSGLRLARLLDEALVPTSR